MRFRKLLIMFAVLTGLLMCTVNAFSAPSANLLFQETDLGGGLWQYDYNILNTSNNGESLYMFLLDFGQSVTVQGSPLPTAWFGVVWEGTHNTSFIDAMSINPVTNIGAGSALDGFSFVVNERVGAVPFHAEFTGTSSFKGTTVVPEPVSTTLFLTGGAVFAARRYTKRKSA